MLLKRNIAVLGSGNASGFDGPTSHFICCKSKGNAPQTAVSARVHDLCYAYYKCVYISIQLSTPTHPLFHLQESGQCEIEEATREMERKGFQKINSFERQNIRQTRLEEPKKLVVKVILVHEALDKLSQEWLQRVLDLMPSTQTLLNQPLKRLLQRRTGHYCINPRANCATPSPSTASRPQNVAIPPFFFVPVMLFRESTAQFW